MTRHSRICRRLLWKAAVAVLAHSSLNRKVKAAVRLRYSLKGRDGKNSYNNNNDSPNNIVRVHPPRGNGCIRSFVSFMSCMNCGNGSNNSSNSSITPHNSASTMSRCKGGCSSETKCRRRSRSKSSCKNNHACQG